ncbi:sterile alpha motif domain containing 1a [Silurus asotus]|uniref:Sterile alpha motif domain containing 1a n=1 Tax=Silurus asotus TaxID=30991 RepID=A0AAD5FM92_SILAS|nr:sterile alpha motif domain containing 1a [Silurus asotus]
MSEPRYREWILDTIDSLRSRKARPDLERICRMVRRRHGSEPDRTCLELERLIREHAVLKVNYKGSVSYRNAAKVHRGRRRSSEQAAAKKSFSSSTSSSSSSSSSSSCSSGKERASPAELQYSDSAQGPADHDPMEDMEDEFSTTACMDSSMDEEDASLDAPCMQIQSSADSGISMSPVVTDAEAEMTSSSLTPSKSPSSCQSTPEKDRDAARVSPEITMSTAQHDTELEAVLQPAAICPSAQRSALMREEEEEPRAGENALTPDQLLSERTASPRPDEAVGSDHLLEGKKCTNVEDVIIHSQGTETANNGGMKKQGLFKEEDMAQDLLLWSVADVASYFTSAGFPEQAVAFRTQEIDGKSLLLMQRSDVLTGLSIRLGPALKIYEHHVKALQKSHFQEHSSVFS